MVDTWNINRDLCGRHGSGYWIGDNPPQPKFVTTRGNQTGDRDEGTFEYWIFDHGTFTRDIDARNDRIAVVGNPHTADSVTSTLRVLSQTDGSVLWSADVGNVVGDRIRVRIADDNSVYVLVNGTSDDKLRKYASDGTVAWTVTPGDIHPLSFPNAGFRGGFAFKSSTGDTFVTGSWNDGGITKNLARLDSDGALVWSTGDVGGDTTRIIPWGDEPIEFHDIDGEGDELLIVHAVQRRLSDNSVVSNGLCRMETDGTFDFDGEDNVQVFDGFFNPIAMTSALVGGDRLVHLYAASGKVIRQITGWEKGSPQPAQQWQITVPTQTFSRISALAGSPSDDVNPNGFAFGVQATVAGLPGLSHGVYDQTGAVLETESYGPNVDGPGDPDPDFNGQFIHGSNVSAVVLSDDRLYMTGARVSEE